ncbi:hypothetical protein [Alloacidobacterium sp.]|uniref:hypothetical protein n=1 Tax=Alloacidobacterium sp. TaxID=2951999 RepID=UPI002D78A835|nr:hypothetical protein [Alloacidobacterium sp.]
MNPNLDPISSFLIRNRSMRYWVRQTSIGAEVGGDAYAVDRGTGSRRQPSKRHRKVREERYRRMSRKMKLNTRANKQN